MNWDALGAFGEIVGALGVIISLIYLATQIKNQNEENRLNAINSMTSQWNAFMGDMANNSTLADIWQRGLGDFDALEPQEQVQLSTHFNRIFRIYETFYRQHQADRLDDHLWEGIDNSMADFTMSPAVKAWWPIRKHWFAKDYAAYIQGHIDTEGEQALRYGKGQYKAPPNKSLEPDA